MGARGQFASYPQQPWLVVNPNQLDEIWRREQNNHIFGTLARFEAFWANESIFKTLFTFATFETAIFSLAKHFAALLAGDSWARSLNTMFVFKALLNVLWDYTCGYPRHKLSSCVLRFFPVISKICGFWEGDRQNHPQPDEVWKREQKMLPFGTCVLFEACIAYAGVLKVILYL